MDFFQKLSIISTVQSQCWVIKNHKTSFYYKYCLGLHQFSKYISCPKGTHLFEKGYQIAKNVCIFLISCPLLSIFKTFSHKIAVKIAVPSQTWGENYYKYSFYYKYCSKFFPKLTIISTVQSQSLERYILYDQVLW